MLTASIFSSFAPIQRPATKVIRDFNNRGLPLPESYDDMPLTYIREKDHVHVTMVFNKTSIPWTIKCDKEIIIQENIIGRYECPLTPPRISLDVTRPLPPAPKKRVKKLF